MAAAWFLSLCTPYTYQTTGPARLSIKKIRQSKRNLFLSMIDINSSIRQILKYKQKGFPTNPKIRTL